MQRLLTMIGMLALATQVHAGGQLDGLKLTGRTSVPGFQDVDLVGVFWDQRCSSVSYVLDDIPANRGQVDEIPARVIRPELQAAFNQWNSIATSYIEMNVVAIRALDNGAPRFDFVNEITFEAATPGANGVSVPISLQEDVELASGEDLDQDGDGDVFDPKLAGRNVCFDIDGDGDIEFPAGAYEAGTIMDNDVRFNATTRWATLPSAAPTVDIQAVAIHEFGHSHGLSHSAISEISATDGTASTMVPGLDADDEASEIFRRDLHTDDIAWSSFIYTGCKRHQYHRRHRCAAWTSEFSRGVPRSRTPGR